MELFKTTIKGIWYTILTWVAFVLLILTSLTLVPFALLVIPIGAFMYASNPKLIITENDEDD